MSALGLTAEERERYDGDGFLIRRAVFTPDELEEMRVAGEEVIEQLVAIRRGRRMPAGSYTFELESSSVVMIKWEGDTDVIHGIEPFAHFHPTFQRVADDARFTEPAREILGVDAVGLFTEKLNYKRARCGGPVVLHQDYPYWERMTPIAHRIATAMIFLDDASLENGCLEVAPGSHTVGKHKQWEKEGFGAMEMDTDAFDMSRLTPLEVPAGTVAFFGAFLVHRSLPNRSGRDRRALLYSYQPRGEPHALELHRLIRRRAPD